MRSIVAILLLLVLPVSVMAAAPKVEYFLGQYEGKGCLDQAKTALIETGFTIKKGTYESEDSVGVQGNYKGVVGCSTDIQGLVLLIVSGPDYKTANRLASKLLSYFVK